MSPLETKARQVANAMVARHSVSKAIAFDIMFILTIISIILSTIHLLMVCRSTARGAIDKAKHPGFLTRWMLRRQVRKHLRQNQIPAEYLSTSLEQSLFAVASAMTEEEMVQLFEEARKQ